MAFGYKAITTNDSTNESTTTLTLPVGTNDGDLLIAALLGNGAEVINSVPSGWTSIGSSAIPSSNGQLYVYRKIASSEPASWDWGWDGATEGKRGFAMSVEGQSIADPMGPAFTELEVNNTTFTSANTILPDQANSLLVFVVGTGTNNGQGTSAYAIATSNPTWTERAEIVSGGYTLAVATANRPQSTDTGVWSATISNSASADCVAVCFSVNPQADTTVSPSVVTAIASVVDATVTGSATASPAVVTAVASLVDPAVSTPAATWTNADKSAAPSWTNPEKS